MKKAGCVGRGCLFCRGEVGSFQRGRGIVGGIVRAIGLEDSRSQAVREGKRLRKGLLGWGLRRALREDGVQRREGFCEIRSVR